MGVTPILPPSFPPQKKKIMKIKFQAHFGLEEVLRGVHGFLSPTFQEKKRGCSAPKLAYFCFFLPIYSSPTGFLSGFIFPFHADLPVLPFPFIF